MPFVDSKLEDWPKDFGGKETVCDTTFTCVSNENGSYWKAGVDDVEGGKECRVDSLFAMAAVRGCHKSYDKNIPEACKQSEPCLMDPKAPGQLICLSEQSSGLAHAIDGSWQCVSERPTPTTHERKTIEHMGGLIVHRMEHRGDEIKSEESVQKRESLPLKEEAVAFSPNDVDTSSLWQNCDWFQGKTDRSCSKNMDCAPKSDILFDVWFDVTLHSTGKKNMRTSDFLKSASEASTKLELSMPDISSRDRAKKPIHIRKQLREMYNTNTSFRESVDSITMEEGEYKKVLQDEMNQMCDSGVCKNSNASKPSLSVFDGSESVVFAQTESGIQYKSGEKDTFHSARVESCEVDDAHPMCRRGTVQTIDLNNTNPTIEAGNHKVDEFYRLKFSMGGEKKTYLLHNSIQAFGAKGSDDVKSNCAKNLCSMNATECPAPYCSKEGNECVPNRKMEEKVVLM